MSEISLCEDNDANIVVTKEPFWACFYDKRKKTCLGRTGRSWLLILIWYLFYYAGLIAFFMSMMTVFLQTCIKPDKPRQTGLHALLKLKPGLGIRPKPDVTSTVIHFSSADPQSYMPFVQNIRAFMDQYEVLNKKTSGSIIESKDCVKNTKVDNVCKFELPKTSDCSYEKLYGYRDGNPCVIIKINKIYGWLPPTNGSEIKLECVGTNPADRENLGTVKYIPGTDKYGTFSVNYYPYLGQAGYSAPFVAVQFVDPPANILVSVKCYLTDLEGIAKEDAMIKFEMLVDKVPTPKDNTGKIL